MKLGNLLIFYGVFGEGKFATWLRTTAVELGKLLIEFMVCYWIWSFWPTWTMIFLIGATYMLWCLGWKMYREIQYDKSEEVRKAKALVAFEREWREE